MNLGLADSLQPQLALEIVIQVGPEGCVYPVQGRAEDKRPNRSSEVGEQREVWSWHAGAAACSSWGHTGHLLGLPNSSAQ